MEKRRLRSYSRIGYLSSIKTAGLGTYHDVSSPETPLSKWNNEHDKGMVRKIELQILSKE
jgi:hypothetical protein